MKSERRHELQHNELAEWLIKFAEAIKPFYNHIFAVAVVAAAALGGYMWWSWNAMEQTTQIWNELNTGVESTDFEKLSRVAEEHPNTNMGRTAAVILADIHLATGCNQRFVSKASAERELSKAIELYESGLKPDSSESLRERATFGLARTKESKGDLESARQYYREVVTKWPHCAYAVTAQQRLDDLARSETKRLFDDFRNFDPKPSFSNSTKPSNPSDFSGSSVSPTELPGLPSMPSEPAVEPKTQYPYPAPDTKPADGKKPAEGKNPAADKKHVTDKQPATEKTGK